MIAGATTILALSLLAWAAGSTHRYPFQHRLSLLLSMGLPSGDVRADRLDPDRNRGEPADRAAGQCLLAGLFECRFRRRSPTPDPPLPRNVR